MKLTYKITVFLSFLSLLFFSIYFYLERTLYVDTATQIFEMIIENNFKIYANRYSMYLSQVFPYLSIQLNFSVKYIVLFYSLSVVFVSFIFYFLSASILKNKVAALTIILIIFGIRDTFFHAISETWYMLIYASFFYAWLNYNLKLKNNILKNSIDYSISIFMIILCFYMHEASIFPISFIIIYTFLDKKDWKNPKYYILFLFFVSINILKLLLISETSHQSGFFTNLYNIQNILPNFFNLYPTHFLFQKYFLTVYIYLFAISFITIIFYIYKKQYLKSIFLFFFLFFFIVITNVIYFEGDSNIGMERSFLPLTIFIFLPFLNDIVFKIKKYKIIFLLLIVFLIVKSFVGIYQTSKRYTDRLNYMKSLCKIAEQEENKKFALIQNKEIDEKLIVDWGLSFETLLYSTIEGKQKTIYLIKDTAKFDADLNNKNLFLAAPFNRDWNIEKVNNQYFNLPKEKYKVIKLKE